MKYTYVGDSSLDGKVDLGNDFNLFTLIGYLTPNSNTRGNFGDYNYDGVVNNDDFRASLWTASRRKACHSGSLTM